MGLFLAALKISLAEDEGGRCRSGRVFALVHWGCFRDGGRGVVVPIAAREHGTSDRSEARIELTAFGLDFRKRASNNWAGAGQKNAKLYEEGRCCTDQKTEYRTAQAAAMVMEVFIVESVKIWCSLGAGVEIDEQLARS